MKRFYELNSEYDYSRKFFEIELDEFTIEVKSRYGYFRAYYTDPNEGRKSAKTYKKLETAERNFEKRCKDWEAKGYVLSDPSYPLTTKKKIEKAASKKSKKIELEVYHEACFEELVKLKDLKELMLKANVDGMEIPESIVQLKNLEVLKIEGPWKSLPDNINELKKLKHLKAGSYYYHRASNMTQLPHSLMNCKSLEKLDVGGLPLTALPANIGKLTNLKRLHCRGTHITTFPSSIGDCKKLQEIEADYCEKLNSLPPEFAQLKNLTELDLQGCKFNHFPEEILKLKKLKKLEIGGNPISKIPENIGDLVALEELDMGGWSDNGRLKVLPASFFTLKKLKEANFYNNKITEIPNSIKDLTELTKLNLSGNPVKNVPQNILNQNVTAILRHLKLLGDDVETEVESLLAPEEQAALLEKYGPILDEFKKNAKKGEANAKEINEVYDFLSFKTNEIPIIKKPYSRHDGGFNLLVNVFAPIKEWTEIEHRLMVILTQNDWSESEKDPLNRYFSYDGFNECFFRWYEKETEGGREPEYEAIVETLKKYGKTKNIFKMTLANRYETLEVKEKLTKFGRAVLDKFKEDPAGFLKDIKKDYKSRWGYDALESVVELIIKHELKTFDPFVEEWFLSKDKKAKKNQNYYRYHRAAYNRLDNLRTLCKTNPKKYKSVFLKFAENAKAQDTIVQLTVDLQTIYGDKDKAAILKMVDRVFNHNVGFRHGFYHMDIPDFEKDDSLSFIKWLFKYYKEDVKKTILENLEKINPYRYSNDFIELVLATYTEEAIPIVANFLIKKDVEPNNVLKLLKDYDYSEYHDKLWELLVINKKGHRIIAARELNRLYDEKVILEKANELIKEGKLDKRDGGVQLLIILNNKAAQTALQKALDKETTDVLRETIIAFLKSQGIDNFKKKEAEASYKWSKANKKLAKPVSKYVNEKKLPALYWKDGKKVEADLIRFLFQKQKSKEQRYYEPVQEVQPFLEEIDLTKSGPFAKALLDLALKNGGLKVANKPILTYVTLLGDEKVIAPIKRYCKANNSVLPAALLGNMTGEKPARALNDLMIHYKSKYPNIREAASESFDKIAAKMGLTRLELMDKMIPDFGFKELFKEFEIEGETWRAFINSSLKLSFLNELNEIKKALPTKASKEIKEEVKLINKEIRTISRQQKSALEYNYINGRKWTTEEWEKHFMKKPLMFAFAQSLIWGIYKDGKLTEVFGISEDQTLENADFDEVSLPKNAQIAMIHPIELAEEQLNAWKEYISDNKLTQPFEQLERQVFIAPKKEHKETVLDNFMKEEILCVTFKSFMEKRGWKRGSVQDGGSVSSYRKQFENEGVEVFIGIDYMPVQLYDFNEKTHLEDLFFTKLGSIKTGSYVYDTYKGEDDERLIKIKDVPPVVYSEAMNDIQTLLSKRKVEPKEEE